MQITISKTTTGEELTTRDGVMAYHFARLIVAGGPEQLVPLDAERPLVFLLQMLEEIGGENWGERLDPITRDASNIAQQLGLTLSFER